MSTATNSMDSRYLKYLMSALRYLMRNVGGAKYDFNMWMAALGK